MLRLLRTSIVFRSLLIVLGVALVVGSLFSAISYYRTVSIEHERVATRMKELYKTVENTISIACYLSDRNLSAEVSRGLLSNAAVQHVVIKNGDHILSDISNLPPTSLPLGARQLQSDWPPLIQAVISPFDKTEKVCDIVIEPNQQLLKIQVAESAGGIAWLLMLQSLAMALTVAFVVLFMITRPIKDISDKLHNLPAEAGALLPTPAGNEKDEIGQLVRDVNSLVNNLVRILEDERGLRIQHQIGEKKYQTIFDNAETGIFVMNSEGVILSHNRSFLRMIGKPSHGVNPADTINLLSTWREHATRLRAMIETATSENTIVSQDFIIGTTANDEPRWASIVLTAVENGVLQGLMNDITERKSAEESATQMAITDPLTGSHNRLGLDRELARLTRNSVQNKSEPFFLLLIDLDRFKYVNDTYGHDAGDIVLQYFTRLLRTTLRKTDFIARLGGDEFVVLLSDLSAQQTAENIAQKIIDGLITAIELKKGVQATIGASIGIAWSGPDTFNKDGLIKQADAAMYAAKKAGRNTFRVYSNGPHEVSASPLAPSSNTGCA